MTMPIEADEGHLGPVLLVEPLEGPAAGASDRNVVPRRLLHVAVPVAAAAGGGTGPHGGERCEQLPQHGGQHGQVRVDEPQQWHQRRQHRYG